MRSYLFFNMQTFLPPCAMSLTVKRLIIIQNINILNKCCSYELTFHQIIFFIKVSTYILRLFLTLLNNKKCFLSENQLIQIISER